MTLDFLWALWTEPKFYTRLTQLSTEHPPDMHRAAFINAIVWNIFHLAIIGGVLLRLRRGQADTANLQSEKEGATAAP